MKMNKKLIVATAACAALLVGSISTSLAWLMDDADPVTNTFTPSTIGVEIKEGTELNLTSGEFKMVPGWTITKDPKAWITEGSEDAILFVKVEESANFDKFMTYALATGWTVLESTEAGNNNVFDGAEDTYVIWREVPADQIGDAFQIIENNNVTVRESITKEDMQTPFVNPELKFTAYAHQLYKNEKSEKFDPQEAWENINSNP